MSKNRTGPDLKALVMATTTRCQLTWHVMYTTILLAFPAVGAGDRAVLVTWKVNPPKLHHALAFWHALVTILAHFSSPLSPQKSSVQTGPNLGSL